LMLAHAPARVIRLKWKMSASSFAVTLLFLILMGRWLPLLATAAKAMVLFLTAIWHAQRMAGTARKLVKIVSKTQKARKMLAHAPARVILLDLKMCASRVALAFLILIATGPWASVALCLQRALMLLCAMRTAQTNLNKTRVNARTTVFVKGRAARKTIAHAAAGAKILVPKMSASRVAVRNLLLVLVIPPQLLRRRCCITCLDPFQEMPLRGSPRINNIFFVFPFFEIHSASKTI
jgi:hypothetical protein